MIKNSLFVWLLIISLIANIFFIFTMFSWEPSNERILLNNSTINKYEEGVCGDGICEGIEGEILCDDAFCIEGTPCKEVCHYQCPFDCQAEDDVKEQKELAWYMGGPGLDCETYPKRTCKEGVTLNSKCSVENEKCYLGDRCDPIFCMYEPSE